MSNHLSKDFQRRSQEAELLPIPHQSDHTGKIRDLEKLLEHKFDKFSLRHLQILPIAAYHLRKEFLIHNIAGSHRVA